MQRYAGSRLAVAVALGTALLVSGCDSFKDATGLTKQPPDEFRVVSNKPLSMPPEFELRPPGSEGERPDAREPRTDAQTAVFGGDDGTGIAYEGTEGMSRGERALLDAAGAKDASDEVRDTLEAEAREASDGGLAERLVFWRRRGENGEIVDARAESERLRRNASVGDAPTQGESPTIEREGEGDGERGWFEGILGGVF